MTRSNRAMNRIVLIVLGLLALGLAAVISLPVVPRKFINFRLSVPTSLTSAQEWIALAGCVLVVIFAIAWIATRGRGRTGVAAIENGIEINSRVAQELLRERLADDPDLVGIGVQAYRVRGTRVIRLRLDVRPGANVRRVGDAVHAAVSELDAALGIRLPVLAHFTTGFRAGLAREKRAA